MTRGGAMAWTCFGVTAGLAVGRVILAVGHPVSSHVARAAGAPGGGLPVAAFEAVVLLALGTLGALVAARRPRNAVGWVLCTTSVSLGVLVVAAHGYWSLALGSTPRTRLAEVVAWVGSWVWIPAMVGMLTVFPLVFPTGRPPTRRWRPLLGVDAAALVLLFVGTAFAPYRFEDYPADNPFGFWPAAEVLGWAGFALMLLGMLGGLAALVVRFRRSSGVERQQLKWVVTGAVLLVLFFGAPQQVVPEDAGFAALLLGMLFIAAAVALAMLRHRLYDIDVVLNRTLVYAGLTAALAATYVVVVLVLQLALAPVSESSSLATAGSTLAAAALFRPARTRIQAGVDRRFYRSKYDAAATIEDFRLRLRDELDLDALTCELRAVAAATMQAEQVHVWLRTPGDGRDPGRARAAR